MTGTPLQEAPIRKLRRRREVAGRGTGRRARAIFRSPMPFSEVRAQDRAIRSLRAALSRGTLHHALLLGGPPGVGKATAARLLAQALNCDGGSPGVNNSGAGGSIGGLSDTIAATAAMSGTIAAIAGMSGTIAGWCDDPCGECSPCRKIAKGTHPDVIWLAEERVMAKAGRWEPEGGRTPSRDIVVGQIRDLTDRRLSFRLFEGRRRVVVIDPADAMNAQAQNALLKTLEEPPSDTTLVLVSAAPDELLPTIRSRCLRVPFGPLPAPLVEELLLAELAPPAPALEPDKGGESGKRKARKGGKTTAEDGVASSGASPGPAIPDRARQAAALCGGSLTRARHLLGGDVTAIEASLRAAAMLHPDQPLGWLAFSRSLGRMKLGKDGTPSGEESEDGSNREKVAEVGEALLAWWRDVLAVQAGGAPLLAGLAAETAQIASTLSPAEALRRRAGVERLLASLRQNAAGPLAVERMLIGWFHGG